MRFRRVTIAVSIVCLGATLSAVGLSGAAPSHDAAPLFEYDNISAGSWSTQELTNDLGGHDVIGGAHAAAGFGEFALTARIDNGDLGLYVSYANTTSSFYNLTKLVHAPTPAADPNVFLDPFGNVDILYVSTYHHLIMIAPHALKSSYVAHATSHVSAHALAATSAISPISPISPVPPVGTSPSPFSVTDLSEVSDVTVDIGLPGVAVSGLAGAIFERSTQGHAVVLPVQWHQINAAPAIGTANDVTMGTSSATLLSDPVAMPGITTAFAATSATGHALYFAQSTAGTWSALDVTAICSSPLSAGQMEIASNGTTTYLASLSTTGHVQMFSAPSATASLVRSPHVSSALNQGGAHLTTSSPTWKYRDLTNVIAGSPIWAGNLVLTATATAVNIAGRAANWGDLYDDTSLLPSLTWTSKDVSLSADATMGATTDVTGLLNEGTLQLFAPGVGVLIARGVGVYAIPSNDWSRAITDGWPIISETGGLGTLKAPWVGFAPPSPLNQSPDYLMGQSIVAAKKRETWLSFWTVSGPLAPTDQTPASYYNHGYLAGQWVAQQIDQYQLNGLNLKPNWVILDPEGYPDNHSALDAPGGSSKATVARYSSYWSAMLNGWATGISNVDPTLRAGVYASMSEYHNYGLSNTPLPVFQAVAFGGGGPVRIPGSNGPNILGYIAFNGLCTPTSTLHAQENTLLNPPWSGQFNTLQFNSGVYCAP